jgi:hypothetical protein
MKTISCQVQDFGSRAQAGLQLPFTPWYNLHSIYGSLDFTSLTSTIFPFDYCALAILEQIGQQHLRGGNQKQKGWQV